MPLRILMKSLNMKLTNEWGPNLTGCQKMKYVSNDWRGESIETNLPFLYLFEQTL